MLRRIEAAFKLKVVEYAELNTNRGAASHFSVNEKQVRLKKDDLNLMPKKKRMRLQHRKDVCA